MVDSDRTIEALTAMEVWSIGVTATLFTIFMLCAFYYVAREHRYELSWLGWLAICMSAFGVLGLPFLYGVDTVFELSIITD